MTILPKFYDHLCVDRIEDLLAGKDRAIDSANCADTKTLSALGWHGARLLRCLPPEKWPDVLDDAKLVAKNIQVLSVRATKAKATCATCKKGFEYYGAMPVAHNYRGNLVKINAVPETCQQCTWLAYKDGITKDRLDSFHKVNTMAGYYVRQHGHPPRPEQYSAVLAWDHVLDDGGNKGGIVLIGDSYIGKTTAAYQLIERLIREHCFDDALAVNSQELNGIPQRVMDGSLSDFMDGLRYAEILLIDDLCKVRITPRIASELWSLFEYRLRSGSQPSPTVITMNLRSKREFVAMFNGKEAESRKIGLSIYNRIEASFDFIDFDVKLTSNNAPNCLQDRPA